MKLAGAIFDVDGTLLDSMHIWDSVGEDYLRANGLKPKPDLRETFKNMSLYQAACYIQKEYGLALNPEEIVDGINGRIESFYRHEAPLKPGAAALLAGLAQAGVKMCVATATDRYLVEAALERLGVLGHFGEIFTCAGVGHGKDEPHIFEAALHFLGTKKGETLVFEDALYAIQTAVDAGFCVAAVYDPYEKNAEEVKRLAQLYLKDLTGYNSFLGDALGQ